MIAEFIGTFVLVVAATVPIVLDAQSHSVGLLAIAFSPAIAVGFLVYAFAKISGAHFNPAMSLGLLINRSITLKEFPLYSAVQIVGAILASIVVLYTIGSDAYLGANFPNNKIDLATIFLVEILLTFLLMGVILASVHTKGLRGFGGAAIGLIIGLDILFGGNISGASMNPARSLAPALLSGNFESVWIYLTATFIGAVIAVFVYKIIEAKILKTKKSSKTRSA
ncbi:MAG: MIP/aquaporin family protein [Nitrososphaerales archaeon]